ncbi:MAG: DUF4091 domain-containing protein [Planctomycetia bacterium]|nr:DUF4091 domain-containing protein [Planctomycetia bacterium]
MTNFSRISLGFVLYFLLMPLAYSAEPLPESLAFLEKQRLAAWQTYTPDSWSLSEGAEGTHENDMLSLTAHGGHTRWLSSAVPVAPGSLLRFHMKAGSPDGAGSNPCGIFGLSQDYSVAASATPQEMPGYTCQLRDNQENMQLSCGQWESTGTFQFSDVCAAPVVPVFGGLQSSRDESCVLPLAAGESIHGGHYLYNILNAGIHGNYDRALCSHNASFNTNRWCLSEGSEVVYKISLVPWLLKEQGTLEQGQPLEMSDVILDFSLCYYNAGQAVLDVSLDGQTWQTAGQIADRSSLKIDTVNELLGKSALTEFYFRIRGEKLDDSGSVNLQVSDIKVNANLNSASFEGNGQTVYAETTGPCQDGKLELIPLFFGEDYSFHALVRGDKTDAASLESLLPRVSRKGQEQATTQDDWNVHITSQSSDGTQALVSFVWRHQSDSEPLCVKWTGNPSFQYEMQIPFFVNQCYTRYAAKATGKSDGVTVSWCEQDYKVPKEPKLMEIQTAEPIAMAAAGNDFESFQLVIYADKESPELTGITATVADAVDDQGHTIAAAKMDLRYAYYHEVTSSTDSTGVCGWWPDALVPLEKGADGCGAPLNITPGCNQPIWFTVHVPAGTPAGTYSSSVTLKSNDGRLDLTVPWQITVWDFEIPQKNRLETAFGMSIWNAFRYQNCQTDEDRRTVLEFYLKNFSEHRISPYNCTPLDEYVISWDTEADPPQAHLETQSYDREMKRVLEKYHFTNFVIRVPGLGGGTFEERYEPKIKDFGQETPQFHALFGSMMQKLQNHLEELGVLDGAYIYWFDEPEPKDYDFVANGFSLLSKYGPKINRMLTEEPSDAFVQALDQKETNIDIWCPISNNFSEKESAKRMADGERFWWYVCTGPKAPFCTLFIDHAATELRVWHWQTFERHITGTLVWESLYWTSPSAFPKSAQNPYLDPMGYVAGGPAGTKSYWGNGDGRFLYPPLAAAVPGRNDGKPILEEPVCSIRWEMIREGVEDYHLLLMLKELAETQKETLTESQKERLADVFNMTPITKSLTEFTLTPVPIYQQRQKIADLIMELQPAKDK